MTKMLSTVTVVLLLLVGLLVGTALADDPPEHPHVLVLHLGVENGEFVYHRCIDLANHRTLRNRAHHETVHTGRAGEALQAAGHFAFPAPPGGCATLEE